MLGKNQEPNVSSVLDSLKQVSKNGKVFDFKILGEEDVENFYLGEKEVFGSFEAWSKDTCGFELTSEDRFYVGYYDGNVLASWSGITVFNDSDLMTIAVNPRYRGYGLAKNMVRVLKAKAYDLGLRSIFLEVRESNFSAISLYEKEGFVRISVRKNYYKNPLEHAVIMQCPIRKIGAVGSEVIS